MKTQLLIIANLTTTIIHKTRTKYDEQQSTIISECIYVLMLIQNYWINAATSQPQGETKQCELSDSETAK